MIAGHETTSPWVPGPWIPGSRGNIRSHHKLLLLTQLQWPGDTTLSVRLSVRLSVGHWNFARAAIRSVVLAAGERNGYKRHCCVFCTVAVL